MLLNPYSKLSLALWALYSMPATAWDLPNTATLLVKALYKHLTPPMLPGVIEPVILFQSGLVSLDTISLALPSARPVFAGHCPLWVFSYLLPLYSISTNSIAQRVTEVKRDW